VGRGKKESGTQSHQHTKKRRSEDSIRKGEKALGSRNTVGNNTCQRRKRGVSQCPKGFRNNTKHTSAFGGTIGSPNGR